MMKGFVVAAVQVLLVTSVGVKFLIDRANYPSVWVETAPYDPDLPIRGRYVSIAIVVGAKHSESPGTPERSNNPDLFFGRLEVQGDRLVAIEDDNGQHMFMLRGCGHAQCWRLSEPLAYFSPEHVKDPSLRPAGETLWVEVTVPPKGAPRPIRLGVRKGDQLSPLELH